MKDRPLSPEELAEANALRKRAWAKESATYDKRVGFFERRVFGTEHRSWACSQAVGNTLEVAIGTGLNLVHYPSSVTLTGLDLSPEMLAIARERAADLGVTVDLHEGDAQRLGFPEATFDTVLCTYSLCNIPDENRTILEMMQVLKPGGRLILVDHVRSTVRPLFWLQRLIESLSARQGEHMTRRPSVQVEGAGFEIQTLERMRAGVVERLVAVKPQPSSGL